MKEVAIIMTAKVFEDERSLVVKLPKEYRFDTDDVSVSKIGNIEKQIMDGIMAGGVKS